MKQKVWIKMAVLGLLMMPLNQVSLAAQGVPGTASKVQTSHPLYELPVLKADFSNVINFNQYAGFTQGQLKMLRENGFVVMAQKEKYPYLKMYQGYEAAEYGNIPMFISTDAVLNLYHLFYGDSLKAIESAELAPRVGELSESMLKASLAYYQDPQYSKEKPLLKKAAAYYATAALLAGKTIDQAPMEVKELAIAEKKHIDQGSEMAWSPILGRIIDYSQYKVRGHYTQTSTLTQYFKAMMWYGQMGITLNDKTGQIEEENVHLALIISQLILQDEKAKSLWQQIYTVTQAYVGSSDDIGLQQFETLITEVYGRSVKLEQLMAPQYEAQLKAAILKLPMPKINTKTVEKAGESKIRQFRVMGQRYTLDADMMQQAIEPLLRPAPSGLDVMAALGSDRAMALGELYHNPKNWEGYQKALNEARASCSQLPPETWHSSLYNGWLWSIQAAMQSFETTEGMPAFMRSKAWTDKSLVTALGSFAELKHDTILYSKQAGAERGGPDSNMPYLYVEPNILFYERMNSLLGDTRQKLQSVGLLNEEAQRILDKMLDYSQALQRCAEKELRGQSLTEEEFNKAMTFGGMVDYISNQLLQMNLKQGDGSFMTDTSAIISDVSTISETQEYVEIGTGIPCNIYVICPYKGKLFLAEGTVFSYYEFTSKERLTDEKWHEMLGIHKEVNPDYGYETLIVGKEAPECAAYRPKWQGSYFSNEPNNVTHTAVEVLWDQSMRPNNPQTHKWE